MFGNRARKRLLAAEQRIRELEEKVEYWARAAERRQTQLEDRIDSRFLVFSKAMENSRAEEIDVSRAVIVEIGKTLSDIFPDRKPSRDLTKSWRRGAMASLERWGKPWNGEWLERQLETYLFPIDRDARE